MTEIVILAAGKGTRMRSSLPKVLHKLAGVSFLQRVISTANTLSPNTTCVVIGHGSEKVRQHLDGQNVNFAEQREQLGTGHAVQQALPHLGDNEPVLILYGDVPLINPNTLKKLESVVGESSMGLLTFNMENPAGYGRIVRDSENLVSAIVEQKDANAEQLQITEINTGVMAMLGKQLKAWLPALSNDNAQGEYYLTDLISMAVDNDVAVRTISPESEIEITGVNSRVQQAALERAYQNAQAHRFLENGLSLLDPSRFDVRGQLSHGEDCEIDINCVFEGKNTLGNKVTIGQNCTIKNAKIGDNVTIFANTSIEDAEVGDFCNIGPYARLRPGSVLKAKAKIGNFVETKKVVIGVGSKVNHLSYVGDAELGENVNVGAGTITCNYDGVNKSLTTIKDGAFIGSNTALVAPVTVGKNATVGAGTVVTRNSEDGQLVVARTKQRNVDGWERPTKK